jgi:hypothetical protein
VEIHGLSISYWNPAWARWKCTGRCSERRKVSSENTRAKMRMSRSRRGNSTSSNAPEQRGERDERQDVGAPAIGAHRITHCLTHSHPNHVGNHDCRAGGDPAGVGAQVAGLHVAGFVGNVACAVGRCC